MLTLLKTTCDAFKGENFDIFAIPRLKSYNFVSSKCTYSEEEDDAVKDCHGDGNWQRFTFGNADVELWLFIYADITAEEEWNLLWEVHAQAGKW